MSRILTWKVLGIAVGVVFAAGFICLATGNTDVATALFVVAALEGVFGAVVVGITRGMPFTKRV